MGTVANESAPRRGLRCGDAGRPERDVAKKLEIGKTWKPKEEHGRPLILRCRPPNRGAWSDAFISWRCRGSAPRRGILEVPKVRHCRAWARDAGGGVMGRAGSYLNERRLRGRIGRSAAMGSRCLGIGGGGHDVFAQVRVCVDVSGIGRSRGIWNCPEELFDSGRAESYMFTVPMFFIGAVREGAGKS